MQIPVSLMLPASQALQFCNIFELGIPFDGELAAAQERHLLPQEPILQPSRIQLHVLIAPRQLVALLLLAKHKRLINIRDEVLAYLREQEKKADTMRTLFGSMRARGLFASRKVAALPPVSAVPSNSELGDTQQTREAVQRLARMWRERAAEGTRQRAAAATMGGRWAARALGRASHAAGGTPPVAAASDAALADAVGSGATAAPASSDGAPIGEALRRARTTEASVAWHSLAGMEETDLAAGDTAAQCGIAASTGFEAFAGIVPRASVPGIREMRRRTAPRRGAGVAEGESRSSSGSSNIEVRNPQDARHNAAAPSSAALPAERSGSFTFTRRGVLEEPAVQAQSPPSQTLPALPAQQRRGASSLTGEQSPFAAMRLRIESLLGEMSSSESASEATAAGQPALASSAPDATSAAMAAGGLEAITGAPLTAAAAADTSVSASSRAPPQPSQPQPQPPSLLLDAAEPQQVQTAGAAWRKVRARVGFATEADNAAANTAPYPDAQPLSAARTPSRRTGSGKRTGSVGFHEGGEATGATERSSAGSGRGSIALRAQLSRRLGGVVGSSSALRLLGRLQGVVTKAQADPVVAAQQKFLSMLAQVQFRIALSH